MMIWDRQIPYSEAGRATILLLKATTDRIGVYAVWLVLALNTTHLHGQEIDKPSPPALHRALEAREYTEAVQLIRLGADVNELSVNGELPLVIAADDKSADAFDVVRELLRFGALPSETDGEGYTALHHAASRGNMAVVDLLIRYGADINASKTKFNLVKNIEYDETPVSKAYSMGHFRVAEYLQSMGAATPDHVEVLEFSGKVKNNLDSWVDRPKPENVSEEDWNRIAVSNAISEAHPRLGQWLNGLESLNPEANAIVDQVLSQPAPEGVSQLQWGQIQFRKLIRMQETGELEITEPKTPKPTLDGSKR